MCVCRGRGKEEGNQSTNFRLTSPYPPGQAYRILKKRIFKKPVLLTRVAH